MNKPYSFFKKLSLGLALIAGGSASAQTYCTSGLYSYGCYYSDYINSVSTTGGTTNITNNNTGCASSMTGYSNYTSVGSVSVMKGNTFALTVVNGPSYSEWYSIYIDFNIDGDWTDPGEVIYTSPAKVSAGATVSGGPLTVTVPSTAATGAARMRIRCVYSPSVASSACSFQYGGEAEDYTVNITPSCPAPNITGNPPNRTTCEGQEVQFSVVASGAVSYQWQVNPGSGWSNVAGANYSGATTSTLTISGVTIAFNSRQYRCIVTGGCNNPVNSNAATLTVNPGPAITSQTMGDTICHNAITSLNVNTAGTVSSYQWEMAISTVGIFSAVPNQPPFSGANTKTLTIVPVPDTLNDYIFRCAVIGGQCPNLNSAPIPMTVIESPVFVEDPVDQHIQPTADAYFEAKSTPNMAVTPYWQASTDGINFSNIYDNALYAKTKTTGLLIKAAPLSMANWWFRCIIKSADPNCGLYYDTSAAAQLKMIVPQDVNDLANGNSQIAVYPNPVTGSELFISTPARIQGALRATVIDKLGRVLYSTEIDLSNSNKAASISVGHLAPGVYNLHISDADGKQNSTTTFTKQ